MNSYKTHPELFNGQQLASFPLLIKLLDASDDLSIQVHPDDEYALEHEGEYGKNECWYVVQAEPGAKIVYGHTAMTPEEFAEKIDNEAWSKLFTEVPVKPGTSSMFQSGTIHAIGGGIVILETQQNSDTTYRVMTTTVLTTLATLVHSIFNKQKMSQRFRIGVSTTNQQVVTTLEQEQLCGKQVLYGLEIRY